MQARRAGHKSEGAGTIPARDANSSLKRQNSPPRYGKFPMLRPARPIFGNDIRALEFFPNCVSPQFPAALQCARPDPWRGASRREPMRDRDRRPRAGFAALHSGRHGAPPGGIKTAREELADTGPGNRSTKARPVPRNRRMERREAPRLVARGATKKNGCAGRRSIPLARARGAKKENGSGAIAPREGRIFALALVGKAGRVGSCGFAPLSPHPACRSPAAPAIGKRPSPSRGG
jgi:hypothetical protein